MILKHLAFLRKTSIISILVGSIAAFAAFQILCLPDMIYLVHIHPEIYQNHTAFYTILFESTPLLAFYLTVSALSYIFGGYVAAVFAGRDEWLNGMLSCLFIMAFTFISTASYGVDVKTPWLVRILTFTVPFFSLLGGYLRILQKRKYRQKDAVAPKTAEFIPLSVRIGKFIKDFLANARCGLKVLFFCRIRGAGLRATPGQFGALILTTFAINAIANFLEMGMHVQFWFYVMPQFLAVPGIIITTALFTAWSPGSKKNLLVLPTLLAALYAVYNLLLYPIPWELYGLNVYNRQYSIYLWPLSYAFLSTWLGLAFLISSWRSLKPQTPRLKGGLLLYAVLMTGLLYYFPPHGIWIRAPAPATTASKQFDKQWELLTSEDIFQVQPALFRKSIAAIMPERAGHIDMYFMGVAPYSEQNVFMHELRTVSGIFAKQFDTAGRSLLLINNVETLDTVPIATNANIRDGLKEIGRRMNPHEDILLLYITSHGSKERGLAMNLGDYTIRDLNPAHLKSMLDNSGITWRVIILAGCHAGVFIPVLRDTHTLIMTAADADHKSFGCSDEGDMTDFAKALVVDQLSKTHDLIEAFNQAKKAIDANEESRKLDHSMPQMAVGRAIRKKLADFEEQLGQPPASENEHTAADKD